MDPIIEIPEAGARARVRRVEVWGSTYLYARDCLGMKPIPAFQTAVGYNVCKVFYTAQLSAKDRVRHLRLL